MAASANISEAIAETPLLSENDFVVGNVDYKGRPVMRSKSGRWAAALFIIGVEMAERLAYYGISSNLINYLTGPLGQSTATAAENQNAWSGAGALLPLLGAFIADSFLGPYRTVIAASVVYILGLGLLTLSAVIPSFKSFECPDALNTMSCSPPQFQIILTFFSLYLVSIAQGMHKPCVQAFAADQFDKLDPEECKAKSSFFNWWGFCICVAISATLVIITYIQDNLSWDLGFGILCIVMAFALVWFLLGTMTYRFRVNVDHGNAFARIGRVFVKAARNWRTSSVPLSVEEESQAVSPLLCFQQFRFLNKALVATGDLKEGKTACSIRDVEEAKAILRLFPIWLSCLGFGIICSQPPTLFTKQGLTMNRSITPKLEAPAASLQCFINVTAIVFVPVYDRFLVPIARSITRKPAGITMLQRIGTGIFFSILSIFVAALVEKKRLKIAEEYGLVDEPNAILPISVAWLIPQYVLFGVSQIFAFLGLQEFFYDQVPSELKNTGIALCLSVLGVGEFLSSILISGVENATGGGDGDDGWFSDNLNKAHLDYFYWLLAGTWSNNISGLCVFRKGLCLLQMMIMQVS